MTMGQFHTTATILPFPVRTRMQDKSGLGSGLAGKTESEAKAGRIARPSFTDGWYHQAAIDEAPETRKP